MCVCVPSSVCLLHMAAAPGLGCPMLASTHRCSAGSDSLACCSPLSRLGSRCGPQQTRLSLGAHTRAPGPSPLGDLTRSPSRAPGLLLADSQQQQAGCHLPALLPPRAGLYAPERLLHPINSANAYHILPGRPGETPPLTDPYSRPGSGGGGLCCRPPGQT